MKHEKYEEISSLQNELKSFILFGQLPSINSIEQIISILETAKITDSQKDISNNISQQNSSSIVKTQKDNVYRSSSSQNHSS